jgi:hypothetical protein
LDQLIPQNYRQKEAQQTPSFPYGLDFDRLSVAEKRQEAVLAQKVSWTFGDAGPSSETEGNLSGTLFGPSTISPARALILPHLVDFPSLLNSKQTPDPNRIEPEVHFGTLALINDAARSEDLLSFLAVANTVDWNRQPAADIVTTVEHALSLGAFGLAGRLASEGAQLHADDAQISRLAHILAPARVLRADLPADPGIKLNREWLRKHAAAYRHYWVAIQNGELLGYAASIRELTSKIQDRKGVLLMHIP